MQIHCSRAAMDARLLHPTLSPKHSCLTIQHLLRSASARSRLRLRATGPASSSDSESLDGGGNPNNGTSASADANSAAPSVSPAQPPPPSTLNIKYRPRSRRRRETQGAVRNPPPPKKEWEAMTLGEKAMELYVGEKGLLFWLNKFAYASIFIIAGGWILFRFVGPSLGLYQLDSSPLPPSAVFKGSS